MTQPSYSREYGTLTQAPKKTTQALTLILDIRMDTREHSHAPSRPFIQLHIDKGRKKENPCTLLSFLLAHIHAGNIET